MISRQEDALSFVGLCLVPRNGFLAIKTLPYAVVVHEIKILEKKNFDNKETYPAFEKCPLLALEKV